MSISNHFELLQEIESDEGIDTSRKLKKTKIEFQETEISNDQNNNNNNNNNQNNKDQNKNKENKKITDISYLLGKDAKVSIDIKNRVISSKDIQSIIDWVLGEGISPKSIFIKNKSLVPKIILCTFEGLNEEDFFQNKEQFEFLSEKSIPRRFYCAGNPSVIFGSINQIFLSQVKKSASEIEQQEKKKKRKNKLRKTNSEVKKLESLKNNGELTKQQQKKLKKLKSMAKKEQLYLNLSKNNENNDANNENNENNNENNDANNENNENNDENNDANNENNNANNENNENSNENNNENNDANNKNNKNNENNEKDEKDENINNKKEKEEKEIQIIANEWIENLKRIKGDKIEEYIHNESDLMKAEFPLNLETNFFELPNFEPKFKLVALDCEMCMTKVGLELTRITIVNEDFLPIYESFCKPENEIIDYLTQWSGIGPKTLKKVTKTLSDIQKEISELISSNTIITGHSLENDFQALKLIHKKVIDTSLIYPAGETRKHSLKHLSQKFLQKNIQKGSHDSKEDAVTALELVFLKLKKGPLFGIDEITNRKQVKFLEILENSPHDFKSSFIGDIEVIKKFSGAKTSLIPSKDPNQIFSKTIKRSCNQNMKFIWSDFGIHKEKEKWKILDSQFLEIFKNLQKHSIFIILSGIHFYKPFGLSQIKEMNKIEEENWNLEKQNQAKEIISQLRKGIAFFCVKE